MGLFSSIFGKSGSDKADQMHQKAIDAFNSIKTPELSALQVQLDKYVNAGQITPEQAETALLNSNAFNSIVTDPAYVGAQKAALQQLQQIGTEGGMTAEDKAQLQDITNQQNQEAQSRNASVLQNAQQRGTGGSNLTAVSQLMDEQAAADRASQAGTQVAANAQARALQALQSAGTLGGQIEGQQYGEQANKAQSQNAIDLFNKQALNQTNLYNTQTANAAQAANLANAQAINNANTATSNAGKEYNAQANQTQFNDALQKAQGVAGTFNAWGNQAQDQANKEQAGSMAILQGIAQGAAQAGGAAMGGPAGAAAAGSATTSHAPPSYAPQNENDIGYGFAEGGEVPEDHPEHPDHMAYGGHVHCYAHGGEVHHHPDCYMAAGGKTPHFLEGLKKGALHRQLGVPSEKSIPESKLEKATHSDNETLRKRAQFAENAKHWNHAEGGEIETSTDTTHTPIDEKKKPSRSLLEQIGDLLGSHADIANKIDTESQGGKIHDLRDGGSVPGKAKVKGDSPKNDTVPAMLSPGEVVVPRSHANDDAEFEAFMAKFKPSHIKKNMVKGGMMPGIPRVNDTNPMRDVAKETVNNPVPLATTNDANTFNQFMGKFKPKKLPNPVRIPPEVSALSNLHKRISKLEK